MPIILECKADVSAAPARNHRARACEATDAICSLKGPGITQHKEVDVYVPAPQLRSPAAVQAAIDEFVQLGRTRFLARYGFGKSRDFLVRDPKTGTDCDSKAISGVAYGKQFPSQGPLTADSFSGGEATVVPALTNLGFTIIRIGEDWSEAEVEATVRDYFEMLRAEAAGAAYNKSEHN